MGAAQGRRDRVPPARRRGRRRVSRDRSGGGRGGENDRPGSRDASLPPAPRARARRVGAGPRAGPPLPFFVAACKAPDGSYWALQSWQRNLPMRGFDPWTDEQKGFELHVSHWSGPLPELEIHQHWTYGGSHQGFFGRLLYQGQPVYGTRSPSARVSDPWARNVYIDTFNSDYG